MVLVASNCGAIHIVNSPLSGSISFLLKLSNTLETDFCVAALEAALAKGRPKMFNTDLGSQFTNVAFTGLTWTRASRSVRMAREDTRRFPGVQVR